MANLSPNDTPSSVLRAHRVNPSDDPAVALLASRNRMSELNTRQELKRIQADQARANDFAEVTQAIDKHIKRLIYAA